jgi:uncharacterized membrane protein
MADSLMRALYVALSGMLLALALISRAVDDESVSQVFVTTAIVLLGVILAIVAWRRSRGLQLGRRALFLRWSLRAIFVLLLFPIFVVRRDDVAWVLIVIAVASLAASSYVGSAPDSD